MFVVVVVAAVVVYPLGSIHVLGALHHHLEIFVDFVVFGFGARRQRVVRRIDVFARAVRTATAILVFLLVQCLRHPSSSGQINSIYYYYINIIIIFLQCYF